MSDFESQMEGWLANVGGLVNLTIEERDEVTQKGAETLKGELSRATKDAGHYNPHRKVGKIQHLADSYVTGNLDGTKDDGNTAVGFSTRDANHARIARFLNDGTVKMKGDSFYDKAVLEAQDKTYGSIYETLEALQKRKADDSIK